MYIKNLTLTNYKNFCGSEFEFSRINCICGNNGVGKTNILDAIYYLSFCRSFLAGNDSENIRYGEDFFALKGTYELHGGEEETFTVSLKKGGKKIIKHGKQPYKKFSEHIGKLPCVIISPYDQYYISGRSDTRRKFIDMILSQTDVTYLDNLINYNKCLEQRNKLLKLIQSGTVTDTLQLDIWTERMDFHSEIIRNKRREFLNEFINTFKYYYNEVADTDGEAEVTYKTYEGSLLDILNNNRSKETILGFTSQGIHRDDLIFLLNNHNVNYHGSQGQQKTFLLALKLAQFDYIKTKKKLTPILLLDDIFDKFDFLRVTKILNLVGNNGNFNQVFITDTHNERVEKIIPDNKLNESKIIKL